MIGKLVVEKWRGLILIEGDVKDQVADTIFRVEHIEGLPHELYAWDSWQEMIVCRSKAYDS